MTPEWSVMESTVLYWIVENSRSSALSKAGQKDEEFGNEEADV
jgi:hypothetical protein